MANAPERIWVIPDIDDVPRKHWDCGIWRDDQGDAVDVHGGPIEEYIRADLVPRWLPIETAPKDGRLVDLWCIDPEDSDYVTHVRLANCFWRKLEWMRLLDDGDEDAVESEPTSNLGFPPWKPTHWMPLPEPPEAK